jgi:hypothetical protein
MTDLQLDQALKAFTIPPPRPEWKQQMRTRLRPNPWMRRLAVAGLAACAALGAAFHDNKLSELSFGDEHKRVVITTRVDPVYSKFNWFRLAGSVSTGKDWTTRKLYDPRSETAFGYETRALPLPGGRFRLEFQALREDPRQGRYKTYRWTSPDSIPSPVDIAPNEKTTVALSHDGSSKLFDELQIVSTTEPISVSMRKEPLRVFNPRLFEDGKQIVDLNGSALSGKAIMILMPGEKDLILRLDPGKNNNHLLVGWVEGNTLEIDIEGHHYRLQSSENISDGPRQQVFGLSKPNDEPKGPVTLGTRD